MIFFVSCVSHVFASVHCCLVVTFWERADLFDLVGDVYCMFLLSHVVSFLTCMIFYVFPTLLKYTFALFYP